MGRLLSNKPLRPRASAPGLVAPLAPSKISPSPQRTPVPASPPAAAAMTPDPWENDAIRKFAFYASLGALFFRFSVLPEVIFYVTHVQTYLLYFVVIPAAIGVFFFGGLQRTFRDRAAVLWLGFFVWMAIATPFSTWKGGSIARTMDYARYEVIFLVLAGGLVVTWKEARAVVYTIAAAAVTNLVTARLFTETQNGRMVLTASGTIGNSNDLAAHMMLVLPFLLFAMLGRGRSIFVRLAVFGLLLYGIWVVLGTASRGGLVALGLTLICLLVRATMVQRIAALALAVVLGAGAIAVLPGQARARLGSLFGEAHREADESADSRWYVFKKSVEYTFKHPLFGVGPDQFVNFEGKSAAAAGARGNWHATHNSFTQVSSECGIPAFLFFVGALVLAWRRIAKVHKKAKREGYEEIANACFCYMLAMVGYLGALVFLSGAYTFYLPAMVSISGAMGYAAMRQMQPKQTTVPARRAMAVPVRPPVAPVTA